MYERFAGSTQEALGEASCTAVVSEEKASALLCVLSHLVQLEDVLPEGQESGDTQDSVSPGHSTAEGSANIPATSHSQLHGAFADQVPHSRKYQETAKHPFERESVLLRSKKWIILPSCYGSS